MSKITNSEEVDMKTCTGPCGETKDDDQFLKKRNQCRKCTNERQREYRKRNVGESRKYIQKNSNILSKIKVYNPDGL
jgi:hypothetical protein